MLATLNEMLEMQVTKSSVIAKGYVFKRKANEIFNLRVSKSYLLCQTTPFS